eukprot:15316888-Alexandrium_andersonii.AAC.1
MASPACISFTAPRSAALADSGTREIDDVARDIASRLTREPSDEPISVPRGTEGTGAALLHPPGCPRLLSSASG